jgi:predicted LPLAT superfamily acyltransferase
MPAGYNSDYSRGRDRWELFERRTNRHTMTAQKRREQTKRIATLLQQLAPDLAGDVAGVTDVRELPRASREAIVHALLDEFIARGREPDDEPNAYGLELEDLMDACGLAWDE